MRSLVPSQHTRMLHRREAAYSGSTSAPASAAIICVVCPPTPRFFMSRPPGSNAMTWAGMPAQVMALLPGGLDMKNLGVGGQTTQMMAADAGAEVDPLYAASRRCNILVCWEGTNDLILGTAPPYDARQAYRHLAAYCKARQRAGFRVVICTVLPRIVRRRGAQDEVVGAFPAHEDVA